jgi:AAA domain
MKFLLDADQTGNDSIAKRIAGGDVQLLPCGSFAAYDAVCKTLATRLPEPDDLVILDTGTHLLSTTRGDFKHGTDLGESVWDKRDLYFGDKQALNAYQAAGNMMMRWLKNLRNVGYNLCVLMHEDEMLDEVTMTTKRGVKANPEARDMLYAASTDIFRLIEVVQDRAEMIDGEPKVVLAKGERLLYIRRTADSLAKHHVDIDVSRKLPDAIKNPTMAKLKEVLGKTPSFLVVYGLPGVGKTTFSTS